MDHLPDSELLGFVGSSTRRLELRRQQDGSVLVLIRNIDHASGQMLEQPHTRVSITRVDLRNVIDMLVDARKRTPQSDAPR